MVHCSKEFVPGFIYVAISCVQHPGDLQVRKFKASKLLKPPADALNVCYSSQEECDDPASKEVVPGFIYVAISCVQNPGDLQVRKFKASKLLKPPADDLNVCYSSQEECDDPACYRKQQLRSELFSVGEIGEILEKMDDAVVDLGSVYLDV